MIQNIHNQTTIHQDWSYEKGTLKENSPIDSEPKVAVNRKDKKDT